MGKFQCSEMEKFETAEKNWVSYIALQWNSLTQRKSLRKNLGKLHCSAMEKFDTAEKFG